jgi:hypothetical protein
MRFAMPALLLALVAACGSDSTAPNPAAWATGTWVAVLANGKPLPFRDSQTYPYVQYDSLVIIAYASPRGPEYSFAGVFPSATLYFSSTVAPSQIICSDPGTTLLADATEFATLAKGTRTLIGNCNVAWVNLTFRRAGDSLAGIWNGADIRLTRRQ